MEGGGIISMTSTNVVGTFLTGIGSFMTAVTENSTLMLICGVIVAVGIGRLAFKTIKRFTK